MSSGSRFIPALNLGSIVGLPRKHELHLRLGAKLAQRHFDILKSTGIRLLQKADGVSLDTRLASKQGFRSSVAGTYGIQLVDRHLERSAQRWQQAGFESATLLVGGAMDSVDEASPKIERILKTSQAVSFPLYVETHRGTLTQSLNTTLAFCERFPELRFNLDLSHWYLSHRLDRVAVTDFIERAAPILQRVAFVHGRYASAKEIQTPTPDEATKQFYQRVWAYVAKHAHTAIPFAPELLSPLVGYGRNPEASDRWADALQMLRDVGALHG